MKFRNLILVSVLALFFLPSLVLAYPGPRTYLIEQVMAHYETNGSAVGDPGYGKCTTFLNPCRYGFVQVAPPNNDDVLQYLRINISSVDNTSLSPAPYGNLSFAGVLANSTAYGRTSIYVNTTDVPAGDDAYEIDGTGYVNIAPDIRINLTSITNMQGGYDLYDADNIYPSGTSNPTNTVRLNFSVTNPSSTKSLSNVYVVIQFNRTGDPDSVDVSATGLGQTGSGNAPVRVDSDTDGEYDRVTWTIDTLSASEVAYVWFNITTTEGTNFNGNSLSLDQNSTSTRADYGESNTLSGRTITGRFSRGPIRQGIDLAQEAGSNAWKIRGFVFNMGNPSPGGGEDYLRYNFTGWGIYEIDPATGTPKTPANQSGNFNNNPIITPSDGKIYTTDAVRSSNQSWFNSTQTAKPYYAVSFNWFVEWNTTSYEGFINTTYDMTTLYKIDMSNTKSVQGALSPDTGGENLTITDETTHLGHSSAPAKFIQVLSVVPVNTTNNAFHGNFTIFSDVVVSFYNGSYYTLNSGTDYMIAITQPSSTGASNGLVNVTINDSSASPNILHNLAPNERIRVVFKVGSHINMTTGDVYNFTGNVTMKTPSTTPLTENLQSATASVSAKQLSAWKDLIGYNVATPTLINASIVTIATTPSSSDKIEGIKFLDYIPNGTDIDGNLAAFRAAVTVRYYNGTLYTLTDGTHYNISYNGTKTLPDGLLVNAYEFWNTSNATGGFRLGNGHWINVTYQMNVTGPGTYVLPTLISGFDPVTGSEFSLTAIGAITVVIPEPLLPLEMEEDEFKQAKMAEVNKPVLWMKDFSVYNPNGRPAESRFSINVFSDATDGYVSYYDEYGKKIDEEVNFEITGEGKRMIWSSKINPFESRSYEVRILTPPVMEVDRNVEVLEKLPEKKVKVSMDVFLKSFAKENYKNVVLNLPIGFDDIIKARDSFGHELQFNGGKDSSKIIAGDIEAEEMKSVNIIYKQSYPTIIVTPEKDEFKIGSPIGLNILVINGGEEVKYPYLEIEIYTPGMDVIESDVKKIEGMEPLEKTELTEKYFLPISAPTGMYLATASFREDFTTLASGTGQFFLTGGEEGLSQTWGSILLLIIIILMGVLSYNRIKSVKKDIDSKVKSQVV